MFVRHPTGLPVQCPLFTGRGGSLLPHVGPLASLALTLGGLPTTHLPETFGIPTVPLVPTSGSEDSFTTLTQAVPRRKPGGSGRDRGFRSMLRMSQGR